MSERGELASPDGRASRFDLERGWVPLAFLAAAVCLPIALAAVASTRSGWVPTGDSATIAVRSFDMWSAHRPLVGQFSLAGAADGPQVFSPGPLLYLVLAPAARFGPAGALPWTLALVSSACFAVALGAARRVGGWWFAVVVACGLLGTIRASGADAFVEVWNPWAGLAPFAALVMVCWLTALGHRWGLVVAVALASFVVQAHLTYLAPSAVLLAVAVVGAWWPRASSAAAGADSTADLAGGGRSARDGGHRDGSGDEAEVVDHDAGGPRWWPVLTAVVVAGVLWAPPLIQQVRSSPGNLRLVFAAARESGPTWGGDVGLNVWWRASGPVPGFSSARQSLTTELAELHAAAGPAALVGSVLLALGLAAVGWVALRRGRRDVLVGVVISLGLGAAAVATAARLPLDREIVAPYALRWVVTAGLVPWLATALAVIRFGLVPRRVAGWAGPRAAAVAIGVVAITGLLVPRSDPSARLDEPARTAGDAVVAATGSGDRVLLADSGRHDVVMTPALAWALRSHGRSPVLVRDAQLAAGASYARRGVRCDAVVRLRSVEDSPWSESDEVAIIVLDGPAGPERVAVDVAPDDSARGRC